MRKGFDSLAALVREYLGHDPLSGHLFLFVSRSRDRIKLLYWDAGGFCIWYKGLEEVQEARRRHLSPAGQGAGGCEREVARQ